jgi:hypothetical protein
MFNSHGKFIIVNTLTTSPSFVNGFIFSAPSEQKWVHFRDPEAITSVFEQQIGYIKTMSAFCSKECTKAYKIVDGKLILQIILLTLIKYGFMLLNYQSFKLRQIQVPYHMTKPSIGRCVNLFLTLSVYFIFEHFCARLQG